MLSALLAVLVGASLWALPPHSTIGAAAGEADYVRLSGPTRYTTAVQIADAYIEAVDVRSDTPNVDTVILASGRDEHFGWAVPTPMLSKLHNAPLLLTPDDMLPRTVSSFLRSDDWVTGDTDNQLTFTVFGGTAVVPDEVVDQVLERATTLIPIGGRIGFTLDPSTLETSEFAVFFASAIDRAKVLEAFRAGLFTVNHGRIFETGREDCGSTAADLLCASVRVLGTRVTVSGLSRPLDAKVNDLITVVEGHRIGAQDSPRPTARFSAIVRKPDDPIDRVAPDVHIIAPAGHGSFSLLVVEENPLDTPVLTAAELARFITVTAVDGTTKAVNVTGPAPGAVGTRGKHQRYQVTLDDPAALVPDDAITRTGGDVIIVARGAFFDEGGRTNALARHVVRPYTTDFRIESVTVGDVNRNSVASVTLGAERFVDEIEGSLQAAVVVSGLDEHAPCALAAASLAGAHNAPMLLTDPETLPASTAGFLAGSGIERVFIVGGSSQVSAEVASLVEQVSDAALTRLGGFDCAAVAVAVARQLGLPDWRDHGRTALLATDGVVADGLAAGPLSYRAGIPLLLARGGELSPDVSGLLADQADHVVILGGRAAVGDDVERALHNGGRTTQRWSGADRFGSAARIAVELLEAPASCFGGDGVGLANGRGAADAIASAPLLGERCHPLLLAEPDALPQITATVLAGDALGGDADGVLGMTILDGRAAMSANVEQAAIRVAGGVGAERGTNMETSISAAEGACHWTVWFGEPMLAKSAAQFSSYRFNGEPLSAEIAEIDVGRGSRTDRVVILMSGAGPTDPASVPTGCFRPLAVRDRLAVLAGTIGSADGSGVSVGAELIVRADTTVPSLRVHPLLGTDTIWVRSSEPLTGGAITITLNRGRGRLTSTASVDDGDTGFCASFSFPSTSYATADLPFVWAPYATSPATPATHIS